MATVASVKTPVRVEISKMGSFYWTKTVGFLLLLIVNEVFESSCADGENNLGPTVISPVERVSYYEGGTSVEGVVAGTPDASDGEGTGECYRPQVIIQPPTCKSAPVKTSTLSISDVHRVIRTELHDVRRKLDAVMTFLALRSPKSSSFVPEGMMHDITSPAWPTFIILKLKTKLFYFLVPFLLVKHPNNNVIIRCFSLYLP